MPGAAAAEDDRVWKKKLLELLGIIRAAAAERMMVRPLGGWRESKARRLDF